MKYLRLSICTILCAVLFSCGKDDTVSPTPDTPDQPSEKLDPSKLTLPAKELRGVWVATVYEIDWPQGAHDQASQKKLYTDYLDLFAKCGINAVFFQIRSKADAYYDSAYEPWSKTITGTAGKDPGYDVLKFLIDQTHARGMQFHAWINPYRIETRSSATASFSDLDSRIPASYVKDYSKIRVYNPALPEVQDRIAAIVKEIITKYDVDGLHMDDYFYPSLESGESMDDAAEFSRYGSGYATVQDFRRGNVDKVIRKIHETIQSTRPEVAFTVSPQGNNSNNYNGQYADVASWTKNGWIDVIIPQCYYKVETFKSSLDWFVSNKGMCHLMVGYGIYRFDPSSTTSDFTSPSGFYSQYAYAKATGKVEGALLYNASALVNDKAGITEAVQKTFSEKVLPPYLLVASEARPSAPSGLKISGSTLTWSGSAPRYAIYKVGSSLKTASLSGVTQENKYSLPSKGIFLVTALTLKGSESALSDPVEY